MRMVMTLALAVAAFAAAPAFAQNKPQMTPRPVHMHAASEAEGRCECRAGGRVYIEGDETCLNGMVAVCDMEQNVTTWRLTRRACPQS
jgi:hypothetical protein